MREFPHKVWYQMTKKNKQIKVRSINEIKNKIKTFLFICHINKFIVLITYNILYIL